MSEINISEALDQVKSALPGLGKRLRAARKNKKNSISEVSQSLLISKKIIDAIENDNYSSIVAPVYAKGYLKAYARFLQLPEEEVLADFERMAIYAKEVKAKDLGVHVDKEVIEIRRYLGLATFIIFSILFILVLIWIFNQYSSSKSSTEISPAAEINRVEVNKKDSAKVLPGILPDKNTPPVSKAVPEKDSSTITITIPEKGSSSDSLKTPEKNAVNEIESSKESKSGVN